MLLWLRDDRMREYDACSSNLLPTPTPTPTPCP